MPVSTEESNPLPHGSVPPGPLQAELRQIALWGSGLMAATAAIGCVFGEPALALRWLLAGLVCWGFVLWQCHQRLHLNRSPVNNRYYTSLGHGNRITLLRGLLIAAAAGFLLIPPAAVQPAVIYLVAALYTGAALGDWLDGYLARRQQQITELGRELDTALDAFGLVIAPMLAVLYGKLHVSYLLVSIAYYLFQWGKYWRLGHGRAVYSLPPSEMRRLLAGLQMALVAVALWPPLPGEMTRILGTALMIPLLIGFCRDWLYVSGRLGAEREHAS